METFFDGVNALRWHYGMIGQPKTAAPPPLEDFAKACGLALGMKDPATFECFCPVLLFNRWTPEALMTATPEWQRGRLRLTAGIGLFFMNFSRLGIPWAMETTVALKRLESLLDAFRLDQDPWNNRDGAAQPEGYYLEFFKPYGLYVNWPLIDFWKQFQWTQRQNHDRVWRMLEEQEARSTPTTHELMA